MPFEMSAGLFWDLEKMLFVGVGSILSDNFFSFFFLFSYHSFFYFFFRFTWKKKFNGSNR